MNFRQRATVAAAPSPARRRVLGALSAASALSAGALAGCKPSSTGPVLRFWAMGSEAEAVAPLLADFERTHPGVRVQLQQVPWSAAHEKLLTAYAGDATPDVCQLGNTWLPEFAAIDALLPLDDRIAATGFARDDWFEGIWRTNVIDGRTWGVPWYIDTRLLFYRRDLLQKAGYASVPADWAGWRAAMVALKAMIGPNRYAVLLPVNEFEPLVALALQQPAPLLRDEGRHGNFRSDDFVRALTFYNGLFADRLAPPVTANEVANVWNEFAKGTFSFYISGPWNIGEFGRRMPAELKDAWATAPLPGPGGPGASIAGGSSLVVFRRCAHPDAAWQLLQYLSEPAQQLRLHARTGNLPPRRSTWTDPTLAADRHAAAFREQLERVRPAPQVPEWERIATELRLVSERMVHGELTPRQAGELLDERAEVLLEKRRTLLARKGPG